MTPAEFWKKFDRHVSAQQTLVRSLMAVVRAMQRYQDTGRELETPVDELRARLARIEKRLRTSAAAFVAFLEEVGIDAFPEDRRGEVLDVLLQVRSVAAGDCPPVH